MKSVIKAIMDKQGVNKAELLRQTKIYKIDLLLYKEKCRFNEKEIGRLYSLFNKPSVKVADFKEPLIVQYAGGKYLNTTACLPGKTQTGLNLYAKKHAKQVSVWYQTNTRERTESTFKAQIPLNADFITSLGLSIGDGLNNPSKRNTHYTFTNVNFQLTYRIFKWLKNYFGLTSRFQLVLSASIKDRNTPDVRVIESKFNQKITIYKLDRYRYPTLTLQTSNRIFQCLHSNIFNKLKRTILHTSVLRRAFLKGLFAAEGHVKHSVYGTLESMIFAYNPHNEANLAAFVKACLAKEQINAKNDPKGYLYFCGYENMIKFYLLGGLSLHKAKEEKFIRLLKNAEVVLHFKNGYLNRLREHSQYELAKALSYSQPAICKALKGGFFPLKHLLKLRHTLDVSPPALMAATEFATIRTSFIRDKEAIKSLLSLLTQSK